MMQEQEQFVSRQVRRQEERQLDKTMKDNRLRRESRERGKELSERKANREIAAASDRRFIRTPVANLIGRRKMCQGWFHRGLFR